MRYYQNDAESKAEPDADNGYEVPLYNATDMARATQETEALKEAVSDLLRRWQRTTDRRYADLEPLYTLAGMEY